MHILEDRVPPLHLEPIIILPFLLSSFDSSAKSVSPVLVLLALCLIGEIVTSWGLALFTGVRTIIAISYTYDVVVLA